MILEELCKLPKVGERFDRKHRYNDNVYYRKKDKSFVYIEDFSLVIKTKRNVDDGYGRADVICLDWLLLLFLNK